MSKKSPLDMSGLLAAKGQGAPANDAPTCPVITETNKHEQTNQRNKPPSSEFLNLGFKVPKEVRHRLRKMAAAKDVSLVEVMREAVDLYEKANGSL